MFGRKRELLPRRKKINGLLLVVRMFLSLIMLTVLATVFYLAFKNFSGYDPLKINTNLGLKNIVSSDKFYDLTTKLLSFSPRLFLEKAEQILGKASPTTKTESSTSASLAPVLYKIAVVTDSHNDNLNLARAFKMAKEQKAEVVIGLGDFTDVGTVDELRNSKSEFDILNMPYYVTAGDHDLWDSRNRNLQAASNFTEVFGSPYAAYLYKGTRLVLIFNSDNYLGLD